MENDLAYYKGLVVGHERNERQLQNQLELLTYRAVQAEKKVDELNYYQKLLVGFCCILLTFFILHS